MKVAIWAASIFRRKLKLTISTSGNGILQAIEQIHVSVPVIVRLEGTNVEEGRALLTNTGLNIYPAEDLNHAAEQAVALAEAV